MVFRSVFILYVVTVVCFLVENIAVHFEYQKHLHFRNGRIYLSYLGGAKCQRLVIKSLKAKGLLFIL
jgi:hypothetical protein